MIAALSTNTHLSYRPFYDRRAAGWCVPQNPERLPENRGDRQIWQAKNCVKQRKAESHQRIDAARQEIKRRIPLTPDKREKRNIAISGLMGMLYGGVMGGPPRAVGGGLSGVGIGFGAVALEHAWERHDQLAPIINAEMERLDREILECIQKYGLPYNVNTWR